MYQQQDGGFIGSKLKLIPHSSLIYSTNTKLLLLAKRQIIRLDTMTQTLVYSNIDNEKIISTSYHNILQLFLVLTERCIIAINSEGELVKKIYSEVLLGSKFFFFISMEDGYKGVPNNRQDFIVYVKGDQLFAVKVNVYYERQLIKNRGICDVKFDVLTPCLYQSPEYIEHSKYLPNLKLLVLWNTNQTYVYKTPIKIQQPFRRLYIYNRISKRQNLSLDYAIAIENKIMAVSYESGVIKIYNFDDSRKYLIELKGHQNSCLNIYIPLNNQNILYSSSLDSTVRIWNLNDYQQVYMLHLDLLILQVHFITEELLFINTNDIKGNSYLCQLNTNLLDPIVNQNKSGHLIKMKCDKEWCISIYSNNYLQFFSIVNEEKHLSNEKIQYPQKYGLIRDVYALSQDSYAIALEKGFSLVKFDKQQIKSQNFELKKLVYNESIVKAKAGDDQFIQLIHQKLLGTYLFNVISDWKNIPLSVKITYVYFHSNKWLPKWDNTSQIKVKEPSNSVTYCVLGTSKGQIFFIDIQNKTHYYSKVCFHSNEINLIRQIKSLSFNPKSTHFMSMSSDKQISIWKLDHQDLPTSLLTFNYNKEFTYFQLFNSFLMLGEKNGQLNILQISLQTRVKVVKSTSNGGHIRAIICGDYMFYKNCHIFLSGGEDSVIKIWRGIEKQLLFQLKLFGIISSVNFTHKKLNLIVCHNEQISFIKAERLNALNRADHELERTNLKHNFKVQQINIRQFFFRYKELSSPKKFIRMHKFGSRQENALNKFSTKDQSYLQQIQQSKCLPISLLKYPASSIQLKNKISRTKRFQLNSSISANYEESLPRINTRQSINHKITPIAIKKHSQLAEDFKRRYREKLYSLAAKNEDK